MARGQFAGIAFAVLGLVLIAAGAAELWVANIAGGVTDLVRPELTDEGLAQHRADFETLRTVVDGVAEDVIPWTADQLGVPEGVLLAGLQLQYPDVHRALEDRDESVPMAERGVANLERNQDKFQRADSSPASWLPLWAPGVWKVILGVVVVGAGIVVAAGSPRWRMPATGGVLGAAVLLIVVPLAFQVPWKAGDANDVLDALDLSEPVVRQTEELYLNARAGTEQFDSELMPDVAAGLGVTREELDAELAEEFPEVAAGLDQMPAVLDRYEARVAIRTNGAADVRKLQDIPLDVLGWFAPAFGAVLGLTAAGWLAVDRRHAAASSVVAEGGTSAGAGQRAEAPGSAPTPQTADGSVELWSEETSTEA